jgi:hypothetical protein
MAKKIVRIVVYCWAFVGLVSMAIYAVLENTFVRYPKMPDQALGRVVPHYAKSVTVYITQSESTTIYIVVTVLVISGGLTLAGIVLNLWWRFEENATRL